MKENFLNPLIIRFNEIKNIIELNKRKTIKHLQDLAKVDQEIPKDLEDKIDNLS